LEKIVVLFNDHTLKPTHLQLLPGFRKQNTKTNTIDLPISEYLASGSDIDLENYILDIVKLALELNKNNKVKTAQQLGISRDKLYTYIKHLKLENI
jgi:DNA-binding NtrC family response regulator